MEKNKKDVKTNQPGKRKLKYGFKLFLLLAFIFTMIVLNLVIIAKILAVGDKKAENILETSSQGIILSGVSGDC